MVAGYIQAKMPNVQNSSKC